MITLKGIQEAHSRVAYSCIHQLVYLRHWERVFWTRLVQVCEVYANSLLPTLLLYHNSIGQPLGVEDLFDSPYSFELHHFIPNSVGMLF